MALVTSDDVKAIIDTEETDLSVYITAAAQITASFCSSLTDAQKKEVQRWLAAHFLASTNIEPQAANEKAGPVGEAFQYKVDLGLNFTRYGQMALSLDVSGGLALWQKKVQDGRTVAASITYVGTTKDD